ncbi:MAG: gliding motility-associated peptidyl-prolyl isomerase GldI [Bacteroidota bacterium]|uniref:Peptidyl-prolyl cis-trans isomerase n=1 Tax=Flagellimonas okinawensis TaxID=3031324 RepID=A0ABT5XKD3_9FLAO|nr:gliding motility-associated peptidyl-prolyl isomerase GldI [[Muricauda] okinawensis]MDF0706344.1 gliding motility-associated peptidyl-prolyl isomerase GldI [[Muricauda] okinawensis]MEC8832896.1 gliding motility-associated peptidyl-prolyl isomerase GldI [Bacteroidota bacterium]
MRFVGVILLAVIIVSCGGPEPRKPVEVKTGSFYKESIERTKQLLAEEEKAIQEIISKDTVHEYLSSPNGFWYYFETKNDTASYLPKTGDQILFTYNLMSMNGDTIYTAEEIGPTSHVIDKQQLFPGLQNAVKLLKINEKATFLFPSPVAYGYQGDNKAIGPKTPIQSSVELHTIIIDNDSLN